TEIIGGRAVITGSGNVEESKLLARRLQAGALPVPINLIAQQTVGPTLGADSVKASLIAGLIGFALVALYMILFYRLPGVAAVLALALYAALAATAFKLIPITLTLSGIAGFILSIGIAVDANVLVFERLKEELQEEGRSLGMALEDSFKRAWPSIRDGHVTILISCAVLFWFSSSVIKGFALTLAVGTIISLFTAIVSTRIILRLMASTRAAGWSRLFLKKA
ncbi:MAG: SecD/SecF family protein translocase subunit, partial [Candidatus Uhrbacteria bacterium]|nr:SecD/SecF family protein translocase subunit [Candidatus Uhrbacteria bacterium]